MLRSFFQCACCRIGIWRKQLLRHKNLRNTEIYINLERAVFNSTNDEFYVKVAEKTEEIKTLLEVGFEYVCENEGLAFFRRRKRN